MKTKTIILSVIISILISSCASLQHSTHDEYAHAKTIELKQSSLALMEKAGTSYEANIQEIQSFIEELEKFVKYHESKTNNTLSKSLWRRISNENGIIKSFFNKWKKHGTLSLVVIEKSKLLNSISLNAVIKYESLKCKSNEIKTLQ